MEIEAGLECLDELIWGIVIVVPETTVINGRLLLTGRRYSVKRAHGVLSKANATEVDDVELAVGDHLVGDLDEEASHSFVGVVVTSDGVDHLDGIHKSGKGLLD
jgi:hypothetical protein